MIVSDGLAFGASCYRSSTELAAAACSSISGTTADGVVSCSAPAVTGNVLTFTLTTHIAAGDSTRAVTVDLQPCEPYDWDFWSPVVGAWFAALVSIVCLKMVWGRMFNRDSSV